MSEITAFKDGFKELVLIIPDLIKALEDLYISIADTIVKEDEERISWEEAIEKLEKKN